MFRSLARSVKHFTTAALLLLLLLLALEVGLQWSHPPAPQRIARTSAELNALLAPSATVHHELQRLSTQRLPDGSVFTTNSLGLRGTEILRTKPADTLRIIVLGDETVLGPALQDAHTLPARLQQFLARVSQRPVEVINAGVPGYSPLLSLLQLKHELQTLSPDLVILHFDMSDVADDSVYRRSLKEAGEHQICPSPLLTAESGPQNPLLRGLRDSALARLLRNRAGLQDGADQPAPDFAERYAWTTAVQTDLRLQIQHAVLPLEDLAQISKQLNFPCLIGTAPVPWQVADRSDFPDLAAEIGDTMSWPATEDIPIRILQAVSERLAMPFCDATAAFRTFDQPQKLFQPGRTELSAYGTALYAREIASALMTTPELAGLFTDRSRLTRRTGGAAIKPVAGTGDGRLPGYTSDLGLR
ncbi:MAG: SGNH/GDSL hydrolase family protein [Fuerstiella sp.]